MMASSMLFKIVLISFLVVATAKKHAPKAPKAPKVPKAPKAPKNAPPPPPDASTGSSDSSASKASSNASSNASSDSAGSSVFDVTKYSASTSASASANSKAFSDAFKAACAFKGRSTILVPSGTYQLGPVLFAGPCIGSHITFEFKGTLVAPQDIKAFPGVAWIEFDTLHELVVEGGGIIDGQGTATWAMSGKRKPINMRFMKCYNGKITGITSKDSKFFHFALHNTQGLIFENIKIIAPWNSKNTDGVHLSMSTNITLNNMNIGTGDDCISIGQGSKDITVTGCSCGPGHGISVGSLGKVPNEEDVGNIHVKNCTIAHTTNGLRIKTWPGAPPSKAYNITFEDITMTNVSFPIIIDQKYCPNSECTSKNPSQVVLRDILFCRVKGTSNTPVAVKLDCSEKNPCQNVHLQDINIQALESVAAKLSSVCSNVQGGVRGTQQPDPCLGGSETKDTKSTASSLNLSDL